jgi:glutaredoxin
MRPGASLDFSCRRFFAVSHGKKRRKCVEHLGALQVTLYTRPGCHLCEEAKAQIAPLLQRVGVALREVNIDEDAALRERYNVDVPVIFLGLRKVAKHRVDVKQFRRQLEEAVRVQSVDPAK